jgi:hypothetical protein
MPRRLPPSKRNFLNLRKYLRFENDSGKQDIVTGKLVLSAWSGDAVYAMDQADEETEPSSITTGRKPAEISGLTVG